MGTCGRAGLGRHGKRSYDVTGDRAAQLPAPPPLARIVGLAPSCSWQTSPPRTAPEPMLAQFRRLPTTGRFARAAAACRSLYARRAVRTMANDTSLARGAPPAGERRGGGLARVAVVACCARSASHVRASNSCNCRNRASQNQAPPAPPPLAPSPTAGARRRSRPRGPASLKTQRVMFASRAAASAASPRRSCAPRRVRAVARCAPLLAAVCVA